MKKTQFFAVLFIVVISLFFVATSTVSFSAESPKFTDADAKILKTGDNNAVADVLYKLQDIYDSQGKQGLKPAIPALIESANRELKLPEDKRWNIVDIVKIMSLTGDERTKPILLTIMSSMLGGGNPYTAKGFVAIGPSVVPTIVDSLKSLSNDTKGRAAVTLYKMTQFDETGKLFTQQDRDKIKKLLADNLSSTDANVRIYMVVALRAFGDTSVIPRLEQIKTKDAHKDSGGTYQVRIEAAETLKQLKTKK